MRTIDETDRALLRVLRNDARISVTDLAATLSLSRATVKARIEALRADGIIRRFTVDVATATEEDMVNALSLLELQLAKTDKVHRALARMPEFTSVHTTNGQWAIVAQSETRNLADFDRLLNRIGRLDGVVNVETCLLLKRLQ